MHVLLFGFILAWAATFFGGFALYYMKPADLPEIASGVPQFILFFLAQIVSTMLALVCLIMRWSVTGAFTRLLAAIPAVGVGLVTFGLGVLFFMASSQGG